MAAEKTGAQADLAASRRDVRYCFAVSRRQPAQPCTVTLDRGAAGALATLLPLLGCGEEAAVLGFERLASQDSLSPELRGPLRTIAVDERVHDALLRGLQAALPRHGPDSVPRHVARRFHRGLQGGDVATHLAQIAGIDAAVCTILSRLLRRSAPLANDPIVAGILEHIRRDEVRHVAISRTIAMAMIDRRTARDVAADARAGLTTLLAFGGSSFELLGVDPDRLCKDVGTLPKGLFPQ